MRIKYYLFIIILLLSTISYAQHQPRWCQQQGVFCSTDRAYVELLGTAHGERLVQSAVNRIENYLNTTCLDGAGRLRTHGRNLCGDYFLRRRLDRILFVSPLAQRQFQLPTSGLRIVRDCEALTLQISPQTLITERGLSLFRHTLENIIPAIAAEAEVQFSEVRRLARVRQTQQQRFIPSGARYEGVVAWDIIGDIIGDISRAASQISTRSTTRPSYQNTQAPHPVRHMSYLPVPSAFPLAITLRTDHPLPTLAVNTTCLQDQTNPHTVVLQRPEDLGFPPLSTNIQYPDARTRRCVEQTYRYFWEQHAYTWRETRLAIDLSDRRVAVADIETNPDAIRWFAELDAGSQNIHRNDNDIWRPIAPSALNDCVTIIANHTEIPLEMRYYYQTIRLRSAP